MAFSIFVGVELKGMPHPVDLVVGRNIKSWRRKRNLTQRRVAEIVGITMQQLQKYEVAANRVSASMLVEISRVLCVSPSVILGEIQLSDRPSISNVCENTTILKAVHPDSGKVVGWVCLTDNADATGVEEFPSFNCAKG